MSEPDPIAGSVRPRDSSHTYRVAVRWTGNRGSGTDRYDRYGRDHTVSVPGKPVLLGSADPRYRGDVDRYNPEELLVAALSGCHMLWYLHLCAVEGIRVVRYEDDAEGTLDTEPDGSGRFTLVRLRPSIELDRGDPDRAQALHEEAHRKCFIAASVNFPVEVEPRWVRPGPSA